MAADVVRVTSKGQATIPAALREKFGIKAPGLVRFVEKKGQLVVEPLPSPSEMRGFLKDSRRTGESAVAELRREREQDERRLRERFG